jgi:Patatin-like phospholipase
MGRSLNQSSGPTDPPAAECGVVMKGGITSGVVYPRALARIGESYRIRSIGGASAGAIGAAVGAAAEFGRTTGGFQRLEMLPETLGGGALASLFYPQDETKALLRMMMAVTGNFSDGSTRTGLRLYLSVIGAAMKAFPVASLLGTLPGLLLAIAGVRADGLDGLLLVVAGALLMVVGLVILIALRLLRKTTVDVPENLFGICRGLGKSEQEPGFTDWLSSRIDDIAGLPEASRPLRFGHLWSGEAVLPEEPPREHEIDLRMITTCLSEGRPYEMPWEARRFYFHPATWRTLFPSNVVDALEEAPSATSPVGDTDEWRWEEAIAAAHTPPLRRLPDPEYLPIIVATRMSLSFPMLISAVPLWTVDWRDRKTQETVRSFRDASEGSRLPTSGLRFVQEWFTDGGFCSNFPLHLFDEALATRPMFAINLGRFPGAEEPDLDQGKNVEWARNNQALLPVITEISERGFSAVGGFASSALNTARNWQDSSYLNHPGYRDRIVRVLQTKREGGLNLYMDGPTIEELAERGGTAADMIVGQFTTLRFPEENPKATGWDNHRWVVYRALLSSLPEWLASYARGRDALGIDTGNPPSYALSAETQALADKLMAKLDELEKLLANAAPSNVAELQARPRPIGAIRRMPRI